MLTIRHRLVLTRPQFARSAQILVVTLVRILTRFALSMSDTGPDHYEVLSLSALYQKGKLISQDQIKAAYRQALLKSHPDKSQHLLSTKSRHTVDEITVAYKTLSTPISRAEYDRTLRLQDSKILESTIKPLTGLDVADLDDLEYNEEQRIWYRSCRCGNKRGYLISEADLEREAEHGEIIAGCGGCSLWLKVLFQVTDE